MLKADVIIIGAGQSGLAMGHELAKQGVDHVILERGTAGHSWSTQRWDSLRLLTPNWMNVLPGDEPASAPNEYMTAKSFARSLSAYAHRLNSPIYENTNVLRMTRSQNRYVVESSRGVFFGLSVVIASGPAARCKLPDFAAELPDCVNSISSLAYKRPQDVPQGSVLVIGASASGQQIAAELQAAGREVTLSVGNHVRMPRRYRGRDILDWMARLGHLDVPWTDVDDLDRVRRTPSLALKGTSKGSDLDLNMLQNAGVEIVGRLAAVRDNTALFSGSLANTCAAADQKMNRFLNAVDEGVGHAPSLRPEPTRIPDAPRLTAKLGQNGFGTIIWATGFKADHSWLDLPVFDHKGNLKHNGGLVQPGLSVMGLNYLRTRRSSFVSGAGRDAAALAPLMIPDRTTHAAA